MSDIVVSDDARELSQGKDGKFSAVRKHLSNIFLNKDHTATAADSSYQMRVLSVIAITFVVLGHINFYNEMEITLTEPLTLHGWFPYYSFHLPLFLFISGYFFKDLPRDRSFFRALLRFFVKKVWKLLVPYYLFSGLSLMLNTWIHTQGFTFGDSFSLTEWLVGPWTKLYFISFTTPVWYLTALFVAEMGFLLLRWLFRLVFRRSLLCELILLVVTLATSVGAVYWNATETLPEVVVVYLRSAVMLFFMQVGVLYRRHLEKHDNLRSPWYFLIVLIAQFFLIIYSEDSSLSPGLYALVKFGKTGSVYFIGGLTGVLLWLRVSRILASPSHRSRLLTFAGKNTKMIMGLHVASWFLFNTLLDHLYTRTSTLFLLNGFSSRWYHSFLYYCNTVNDKGANPRMILMYYLVGMALPLLVAGLLQLPFHGLRCLIRRIKKRREPI